MTRSASETRLFTALAVGLGATVWAYWTTLADIVDRWANDPQYSHGFLVPLFSGYLLWSRQKLLAGADLTPRWWGVGIVLLGAGLRLAGHFAYQPILDSGSLLVVLFGLVAACGGRGAVRWAWPAVLFLAFMIPLPFRLQTMLGGRLQQVATIASTFILQTVGIPAVSQGNTILLSDAANKLEVAAACSGLSMLMTFLALAVAVVILTKGWPQRVAVLLSALPIAVAANVVRITVTGILFEYNQGQAAREFFHDWAGYLMMPLALGMMFVVLHVVGRTIVPVEGRPARAAGPAAPAGG
ncbi:MAG: exosortase/archaeosortase family protein, partial [Gemmataceae bacterium]|nr:exosortase/archaeosortase family protein [Gemmataceae bacterium]